jgi:hypothetical protein
MSTILKALRQLEDEQRASAERPLHDEVSGPRERRWSRAPWLALAVGAALGLGVAWLWPGSQEPAQTLPEPAAEPALAAVPVPETQPPPQPKPLPALAAVPVPETQPPPQPKPLPAPQAAEAKPLPALVVKPRPRPKPVAKPTPPEEPAVAEVPPLPLPELVVASTVWHPDPARRSAVVEVAGRDEPLELLQGDAVGPLVVSSIEPSGVVFLLGQVEVRRRVGERP